MKGQLQALGEGLAQRTCVGERGVGRAETKRGTTAAALS